MIGCEPTDCFANLHSGVGDLKPAADSPVEGAKSEQFLSKYETCGIAKAIVQGGFAVS